MLQNLFLHKTCLNFVYQRILTKKIYHGFHKKKLSSTTVFNIDNNNKCFMRGNIRMISEGSCDKVWTNYAENSALRQTEKNLF